MKWMLLTEISPLVGYSIYAIRAKISKGVWLKGIHWKKSPDGRIHCNLQEIQKWIES